MKLNQAPNLRTEDFQSEQSWIGRLFIQLNPFIQAVNQVFDQNIEFGSNIKSLTREYTIRTFQPFNFQWPYSDKNPNFLQILQAFKGSQLEPTILQAAWKFDSTSRTVTVTKLLELTESGASALSGNYRFTLRVTV